MSTMYDADPTTYSPRGEDATIVSAWSSSPLGDPAFRAGDADEDGYPAYRGGFRPDPITPAAAKPKPMGKAALAAGVIGAIGMGAALGIVLIGNSTQPRTVTVTPGSTGAPIAVPAAGAPTQVVPPPGPAPAQAVAPPDNGPAPTAVVAVPDNSPAPIPAFTQPDNPAPPADPGSPPALTPPGPVVNVNVPLPPVSVSVQPPQLPPLPSPPKLPPPPVLCLPPHHLVKGVCK